MWENDDDTEEETNSKTDSDITIQSDNEGDQSEHDSNGSNGEDSGIEGLLTDADNVPKKEDKPNGSPNNEGVNSQAATDTSDITADESDSSNDDTSSLDWGKAADDADPTSNQEITEENNPDEETSEISDLEEVAEQIDRPPAHLDSTLTRRSWPELDAWNQEENLIKADNPSKYSYFAEYAGGLTFLILSGLSLIYWFGNYLLLNNREIIKEVSILGINTTIPNTYLLTLILVFITSFIYVTYFHLERKHTWYILTDQRIWNRKGILGRKDAGNIDHPNITNNEINRSYLDRQFGVGDIEISTASSDGPELFITGIENPNEWQSVIRSQAQEYQESKRQNNNAE